MTGRPRTTPLEVTDRQLEVARLVAAGYTNERIAQELGITHDGAKYHVSELLGRLGFERREEITAWYRSEHGSVVARTRRRLRSLTLLPAGLVAGGAVVGVAALVLLFVAFEGAMGGGDTDSDAPDPGSSAQLPPGEGERFIIERGEAAEILIAEYVHEYSGERWETRAAADLGERDLMFLVWAGGRTTVHGIDRATGERVAEVSVGDIVAHVAHAPGRLLVSRIGPGPTDDPGRPGYTFFIFDIADGLSLEAEIPLDHGLPQGTTSFGPALREQGALAFSTNGRYLYYLGETAEAWGYHVNYVGIIDLDGVPQVVAGADVEGCVSEPALYPAGDDSVLMTCSRSGTVQSIAPDGTLGPVVEGGGLAGYFHPDASGQGLEVRDEENQAPVQMLVAAETSNGTMLIYLDGTYAVADGDHVEVAGSVLPPTAARIHQWQGNVTRFDTTRLAFPTYRELPSGIPPGDPPSGIALFNTETAVVEYEIEITHYGSYPINSHEIALVGEQRVDILDLLTMRIVESYVTLHPDAADSPDMADRKPAVR